MPSVILASQSPRRRELLHDMGVKFDVIPSNFQEALDESRDAALVAKELALGKALDVARQHPEAIVIGSDTIVAINGRQMEKPIDIEDAREMLIALSKGESTVSTGVAVVCLARGIQLTDVMTSRVFFKPDSPAVTAAREVYLASDDWHDKAGGYGIQSGAAPLIAGIDGAYDAIIGLPTELLARMLRTFDITASATNLQSPVPHIKRG